MFNETINGVEVFEVGKSQLEGWIKSGSLDNPPYAAYPVLVGDYVIVQRCATFGHQSGFVTVWTGYSTLDDVMGKLPPLVEYRDPDRWYMVGFARDIEVWHVVDDAALYVGMPVLCPVGGTCYLPYRCKAEMKHACPRFRAYLKSLRQLRAAGELSYGSECCGSF